ncbi:hypothetical protein PR202_ga17274 [Eleusine coracana subsp. coracana]|uniref:RING-type E3 ubiquitin transferase n=1 Tax=Eleusine coracana subsp. coracana TaxID=191504 RepID=A0AAV5CQ14_ELECO|nr:hypothetical protein PR202_ga17274 [Eleusine coracana subsp. coracana]
MSGYGELAGWLIFAVGMLVYLALCCKCTKSEEVVERERAAVALAAHEALASRRAAALLSVEQAARPPLQVELPYFPYAGRRGGSAPECAICLEPLRQGQLCSEVPVCRHAFHKDCLGLWAKSKGSCPLCRAKITLLGSVRSDQPTLSQEIEESCLVPGAFDVFLYHDDHCFFPSWPADDDYYEVEEELRSPVVLPCFPYAPARDVHAPSASQRALARAAEQRGAGIRVWARKTKAASSVQRQDHAGDAAAANG